MSVVTVLLLGSTLFAAAPAAAGGESHQATGVKVGEVTPRSALVWVRLTARPARNAEGLLRRGVATKQALPPGVAAEDLRDACPGAPGRARVRYAPREDLAGARDTGWAEVTAETDFAHVFLLNGLEPGTRYYYASETTGPGGQPAHAPLRGTFATAPPPERPAGVSFTVMTCQAYKDADDPDGFLIYDAMARQHPDFYVAAGDLVYLDSEDPRATTIPLARYHWQRMYGFPKLVAFHLQVPGYFVKDDHDTYHDDGYPTEDARMMLPLTFRDGQRVFHEQNPVGESLYRTFRWGKSLQLWLVEGRDFRSPNPIPDGPDKSIWGETQKRWLKETVLASDADWKILLTPTPLVGPDRPTKKDNHSNVTFAHEGNEIRGWIRDQGLTNLFAVCGDRHWQYHSVHPETGLHEFGCGPASDRHAGGSPGYTPQYHRFHRELGGFLTVAVSGSTGRPGAKSTITFHHHDVNGQVVHEYQQARDGQGAERSTK
jgi:alkaline phosphatase D